MHGHVWGKDTSLWELVLSSTTWVPGTELGFGSNLPLLLSHLESHPMTCFFEVYAACYSKGPAFDSKNLQGSL